MHISKYNFARLRIGMLITSVDFGGLEKVVIELLENIEKDSFEVVPLLFIAKRKNQNAFVSYLQKSGKSYFPIVVDSCRFKYANPVVNLRKVYSLLKNQKFDILHTHGYRADVMGYLVARALNVPTISTCHGFIPNDRKLRIYNSIDRYLLRYFNRVIAVSMSIRESLVGAGVKEKNISIIPNAVKTKIDASNFHEFRNRKRKLLGWNDEHFVCGYVGRLSEEKGLEYLIQAISHLSKNAMPVKLALIGDGTLRNGLERISKDLATSEHIAFLGFQENVQDWLPSLDVFVLPSLMEGTPLALLEAMLCGIPIIATKVGGIPDVVETGKNGILVNPGRSEELVDAISLLYRDRYLCTKIGKEARATVRAQYDVKQWIKKIEVEYIRAAKS